MQRNIIQYGIPYSQRGRFSNYSSASDNNLNVNNGSTTTYTINASSTDPSKGTVGVRKAESFTSATNKITNEEPPLRGTTSHPSGTTLVVTAVAYSGYRFKNWEGDYPAGKSTTNPLQISLTKNVTLRAVFERVPEQTYTVNVNWDRDKGNVTGGSLNNGSATVHRGDSITLSATPKSGYKFVRWEGVNLGGNIQDNNSSTITLTISRDLNLTAVFAEANSSSGSGSQETPGTGSGSGQNNGSYINPGTIGNGSSSVTNGDIMEQAKGFLKKWWWAVAIIGYILYKNWKGGKE